MPEIWDAYDEHLNKLDIDLIRGEPIPEGMFHIVVSIWTIYNHKILVTRRDYNKIGWPGMLEVTGGSILKGETPKEGAKRELLEETGITTDLENLNLMHVFTYKNHFMYVYYVCLDEEPHVKLQEGETIDYQWMDFNEIQSAMKSGEFVPTIIERFKVYESIIKVALQQTNNNQE